MNTVLLPFPAQRRLAEELAPLLDARLGHLDWRRFPDGESLVTIDEALQGADAVLLSSLNQPDALALALRFAAATAREFGARSVGLVAPYLAYMRQDRRFHPGEAVSAPLFAAFLQEGVDWLVTVDPHLHRIDRLERIFRIPTRHVAAAPAVAAWIRTEVVHPLLIGPDGESAQWVAHIAALAEAPFQVLHKERRGDRDVVRSVAANAGARFSDTGYSGLVRRAVDDGMLAVAVGRRDDVPAPVLKRLLAESVDVVRRRLFEGATPTAGVDIYGLAATVFTLIKGEPPFQFQKGENPIAFARRVLAGPVPDLRANGVADAVCTVLEQGLNVDPAQRPATAAEFGELLRAAGVRIGLNIADVPLELPEVEYAGVESSPDTGGRSTGGIGLRTDGSGRSTYPPSSPARFRPPTFSRPSVPRRRFLFSPERSRGRGRSG